MSCHARFTAVKKKREDRAPVSPSSAKDALRCTAPPSQNPAPPFNGLAQLSQSALATFSPEVPKFSRLHVELHKPGHYAKAVRPNPEQKHQRKKSRHRTGIFSNQCLPRHKIAVNRLGEIEAFARNHSERKIEIINQIPAKRQQSYQKGTDPFI